MAGKRQLHRIGRGMCRGCYRGSRGLGRSFVGCARTVARRYQYECCRGSMRPRVMRTLYRYYSTKQERWALETAAELLTSYSPRNAYPDKSSESRVCVYWVICPFISFLSPIHRLLTYFINYFYYYYYCLLLLLLLLLLLISSITTTRILKRTWSVWWTFSSRTTLDLLIILFVIYIPIVHITRIPRCRLLFLN